MASAGSKTFKGTVWSMVERFSTIGVQLLCTLVIAQFLDPSQFGLIGMMSIFLAFSGILVDAGFSQALIREKDVTQRDYSSVFYFNVMMGCGIYLIFFFSAPIIADFYNEPVLVALVRWAFLAIVFMSLGVVQQAQLFKKIDFKKVSHISVVSVVCSGIIGIAVAVIYKSVWALVAQNLTFAVLRSTQLWIIGKWFPSERFNWSSVKKYLGFSLNLLGANIIAAITDNLPNMFIGKAYSAAVLGNYTIPNKLQTSVAGTLSFSIHRVSYPVMAEFQDDITRLRSYSQKVVNMAFFIISPVMLYLLIESHDLFAAILPPDWGEAAHYFQYMCVIGAIYCFADINMDVLLIRGKSQWVLAIEIVRKIVFVLCLLAGIRFSIDVLLQILIGYNLFNAIFVSYFSGRLIDCTLWHQFKNLLSTVFSLVTAFSITYFIRDQIMWGAWSRLIATGVVFVLIYLSMAYILKSASLRYAMQKLGVQYLS